ncbi:MAG: hypothetical protein AAF919_01440 [Pseudomonadota bacterium]
MRFVLLLSFALAVAGCGRLPFLGDSSPFQSGLRGTQSEVQGIRFRTRVASSRATPRMFTTTTRGASRNVGAALEAGRVRAVEYCLRRFGGSEIAWQVGPDRAPEEVALEGRGLLVLSGTCTTR